MRHLKIQVWSTGHIQKHTHSDMEKAKDTNRKKRYHYQDDLHLEHMMMMQVWEMHVDQTSSSPP